MDEAISVAGLCKRYRDFSLEGIGFALPRGEVMGFIGANGAGKTTTIKSMLGLVRADSGTVRMLGLDAAKDARAIRERIGFVHDEASLNEELSAREVGRIVGGIYRSWDADAYAANLARFGLRENQRIKEYSKGMRVKIQLAIALSHGAELIIMDEPTSGLDPVFRSQFLDELFAFIQDEGRSVFFSTHITEDLARVADRVTMIDRGRLVFSMPKDEALDAYRLVKGGAAALDADLRPLCLGARVTDSSFTALVSRADEERAASRAGIVIERPTLDDIMVYLSREDYRA